MRKRENSTYLSITGLAIEISDSFKVFPVIDLDGTEITCEIPISGNLREC